jgi:TM2 domain-containing membrane protein YozV
MGCRGNDMTKLGILGVLQWGWIGCAYAATSDQQTPSFGVWHGLLLITPLVFIGVTLFAIYKALAIRKRKPAAAPDSEDVELPSAGMPIVEASEATSGRAPGQKQPHEKFCHECGAVIRMRAEICPKCGVRQPAIHSRREIAAAQAGRSKLTAALFALLLGGLGMHKFYLGKIGQGIVYLLFCWTFIPAFIGLVEGIVLLAMSERDFQLKYAAV